MIELSLLVIHQQCAVAVLVFIHVVKGTGTQDNKVNNAGV